MKKSRLTWIAAFSLVVVLVIGLVSVFAASGTVGDIGTASRRDNSIPTDGQVYIEPNMAALAGELSGSPDTMIAARNAFDQINAQRQAAGLSPLIWSDGLEQASAVRAVEASQKWSHDRPNGTEYWTVNSALVYGENLAMGYYDAPSAVTAWMNSPTHKDNILYGPFKTGGIAIHIANGKWYWANEFGY
ncbi:MAG: CAP domain-containing protein [Lachnospiraceae bacterium]|nr:CAP domain-containing protein [Lachnospiraceae bacterium]